MVSLVIRNIIFLSVILFLGLKCGLFSTIPIKASVPPIIVKYIRSYDWKFPYAQGSSNFLTLTLWMQSNFQWMCCHLLRLSECHLISWVWQWTMEQLEQRVAEAELLIQVVISWRGFGCRWWKPFKRDLFTALQMEIRERNYKDIPPQMPEYLDEVKRDFTYSDINTMAMSEEHTATF